MYYPIRVAYTGINRADRHQYARGNRDHYEIRRAPGRTNMSHQPLTDGWLGTTDDWSRTALGECETLDQARRAIDRDDPVHTISPWWEESGVDYDQHDPDLVEVWVPRNTVASGLITVDWDADVLDIQLAEGAEWLASVTDGSEYEPAWVEAAGALDIDPEDYDNRDAIIAHLSEQGWEVEEASDAGWDYWICVGRRPE